MISLIDEKMVYKCSNGHIVRKEGETRPTKCDKCGSEDVIPVSKIINKGYRFDEYKFIGK